MNLYFIFSSIFINYSITFCVFFHWLIFKFFKFNLSKNFTNPSNFILAGLINLTAGLFWKFSLWSLRVNIYYLSFYQDLNNITFSESLNCFQYLIFTKISSVGNICRILGLLSFLLMFLVFSLLRFYIYPAKSCLCFFRFNFSFWVKSGLEKII